jgi:hypothetical protein
VGRRLTVVGERVAARPIFRAWCVDEVLARAMTRKPERIEWDETTTTAAAVPKEDPVEEEAATLTAH